MNASDEGEFVIVKIPRSRLDLSWMSIVVGSRPALAGRALNEADSGINALYVALGQIKGINNDCERHKIAPWQLQCETCRLFVARELAFQGVRALPPQTGNLTPQEVYLVEKARDLIRQGCAMVTTNHGVLMTYAEHGRLSGAPQTGNPPPDLELLRKLLERWEGRPTSERSAQAFLEALPRYGFELRVRGNL